jgi:hypothetical protein
MPIPNGKSFPYQEQRMRNARCVATGDPPCFINPSTIKARCSPDHAMVFTENGTYTAVQRRAPHPKPCPSQIGEFFLPHPVYTTLTFLALQGDPYIYDIRRLRVKFSFQGDVM